MVSTCVCLDFWLLLVFFFFFSFIFFHIFGVLFSYRRRRFPHFPQVP